MNIFFALRVLILCNYFSSPSSSHFELVFLIILIDLYCSILFFLITVYSCSTSPMCAVQCQALPLSSTSPPFCVRRCNLSTYLLIVTTSVEVMEVEIICIVPEQGAEEKVLKRYQYYQPSSMRTEVIVN